jgi:hypothetical protein
MRGEMALLSYTYNENSTENGPSYTYRSAHINNGFGSGNNGAIFGKSSFCTKNLLIFR